VLLYVIRRRDEMEKLYLKIWLAGFIDGDGSIYLTKHGTRLDPVLCLTNTKEEVRAILQELYPFRAWQRRRRKEEIHQKDSWQWYITKQTDLIKILKDLIPYLQLKRKQAELLLKYCLIRQEKLKGPNRNRRIGKEEWAIYYQLKELNRKGRENVKQARVSEIEKGIGTHRQISSAYLVEVSH